MNGNGKLRFYVTEQISENIAETPEGYLLCTNVPITRIGEFIYKENEVPVQADPSGIVRIQRDEADVFEESAIASFEGKPVTIDHPSEPVTPENWSELAHGTVQNIRRGESMQSDLMLADLLITTEKAIELVKGGLREISCGYDANYSQLSEGVGKQKDIIGNHVALVSRGRAGKRCAIADKACSDCGNCGCNNNKVVEEVTMGLTKKIRKWLDSFPVKDAELEELEEAEKKKAKDEALAKENLPIKLKEIKDTYDKWLKDAAEGKLDASKLPIELKKVKDQEEEEEEEKKVKDQSAEELAKKRDKDLKDPSGEAAKDKDDDDDEDDVKDQEEEEEEVEDKRKRSRDKRMKDLEEKVDKIGKTVEDMAADVRDALDRKSKDAEEAAKAEESEKAFEEKKSTGDAWTEVIHRAEVLNPGMTVRKPKKDFVKAMRQVKIDALNGAYTRDDVHDVVKVFTKDGDFEGLSQDALDAAFLAASELVTKVNNSRVHKGSITTADFGSSSKVVEINKKNKEFYYGKK